jgi:hypothetical protein
MKRTRKRIPKDVVKRYLENKEGCAVEVLAYKELGSGWHGTGYKVKFKVKNAKNMNASVKEVVLRTLMPENFSHDFLADRAKVFVTAHEMSKHIPNHINSYDVSGYSKHNELISIGDSVEFFQVVEVAYGDNYSSDFQRIKDSGIIEEADIEKAENLGEYLAKLHEQKFTGTGEGLRSLRRRISRDALGHGEMMLGVIDSYPDKFTYATADTLTELICETVKFREKMKDAPVLPCRVHGDFHPGNIIFDGQKFKLLDASRMVWGDPADDVAAMGINYIWFAVMQEGAFSGPFKNLFDAFWSSYMKNTSHKLVARTIGVHFAFRGVVVAHPFFYQAQTDDTRRKMIKVVRGVLKDGLFDPKRVQSYIKGK